jgi:hypothetical protein
LLYQAQSNTTYAKEINASSNDGELVKIKMVFKLAIRVHFGLHESRGAIN